MTTTRKVLLAVLVLLLVGAAVLLRGRVLTTHPHQPSTLGTPSSAAKLLEEIDVPGTLEVTTVASADWVVDRAGLINLEHPKAKAAGLQPGDEPIHIFFHAIRHPTRGLFVVDTGVSRAQRDDPDHALLRGPLAKNAMNLDKLKVRNALGDWLAKQNASLQGVLLTHLHADHLTGMPDVPKGTAVYAGAHESEERNTLNLIVGPMSDEAFEGKGPISEWQFQADPSGRFEGVIDVFGDGQLFAIRTPGHTVGSTAYIARTANGPVLFTGDDCHSAWGWKNDVEPGKFTADREQNAVALAKLRALAKEHPQLSVRLGHQWMDDADDKAGIK